MGCEFHWDFIHFHIIHHHHKHLSLFKRTFGPQVFTLYFDSFHSINQTKNSHFPLLHHFPSTTMHSSSIITALIAFAGIVSAVPTAMKARDVPVIDVFISEATQDSHASQVEIGVLKVLIGDNGFAPAFATELSISPWGANVDITQVSCDAFTDVAGTQSIGSFTSAVPLYFNGATAVGSVNCDIVTY
jgi:hypothetical protein